MKLIDYDKYDEMRSQRGIVVEAVLSAICTGFFLGVSLIGAIERRDA